MSHLCTTDRPIKGPLVGAVLAFTVAGCQGSNARLQPLPAATRTPSASAAVPGRVLLLPGVANVSFPLADFAETIRTRHPGFEVGIRTWGPALLTLHNLMAHARNQRTAQAIAAELTAWRQAHPQAPLYVLGYSGGGGLAVLVVDALPENVQIDRLVLVAAAISPDFDITRRVLPHVREYVINYSSRLDLQVGWGTEMFGTIDRRKTVSAGYRGFDQQHPRVLEWHWSPQARSLGHYGNHLSYLGHRWQKECVLPVIDPQAGAMTIRRAWRDSTADDAQQAQVPSAEGPDGL